MATTTNNGWTTPDDTDLVKDGALAIRDLGQEIDTSVGTGLLAWTAYTPTFSNLTLGNGTISFAYAKLGKIVEVRGVITFGSTTSVTGGIQFSTPITAVSSTGQPIVGHARYNDTGTANYFGNVLLNTTGQFATVCINAAGTYGSFAVVNATTPHTWANTDILSFQSTYQAA